MPSHRIVSILFAILCAPAVPGEPAVESAQARAPAAKASQPMPGNALRVRRIEVMDANGFEKPLVAAFGFIPVGWQPKGGVEWGRQYACTNGYAFNWSAASPDGSQGIAFLAQEGWATNNFGVAAGGNGCANAPIVNVQQYLQNRVSRLKPGARVTGIRPRPDIAAKFASVNRRTPTAMGEMRTWIEAGEAQFTYAEQGRSMRGVMVAGVVFSSSRMRGVQPGQTMDSLTGISLPVFLAVAPEAQLNAALMEALRQSFLTSPEWDARIAGHNAAISRVAIQESAKRSRIIAETNDYIARLRQETAASTAASQDRNHREFGEAIRGQETYDDSNAAGGRVELSNFYDHAWRLNDGTYVLTNDVGFDPWKNLGVEGTRLNRTQ